METLQSELKNKVLNQKTTFFPGYKVDICTSPVKLADEFKNIKYIRISICCGSYKIIQYPNQIVATISGYEMEFHGVVKSKFVFKTINKLLKFFKTNKYINVDEGEWYVNTEVASNN